MLRVHDLPHGATIDLDDQVIRLPVGEKIILKFGINDFQNFCDIIDDLKMILDFYSTTTSYQCQKCGSVDVDVEYDPPAEADEN
tara:strand:+ start:170 stop:421 length:252 start_codon:yes stop_codon:yes gene_type:complete